MPKDTFFNLPDDKKKKVIQAAIDEFAVRSYHKARITAIINKAGIAKGSFYQYFEDKKDLFKYLVELTVQRKLAYINQEMMVNREKYDFFQLLREIYLSGIRFAKEHPRLALIGGRLLNDKKLLQEIIGEYKDMSYDFFKQLLEYGIEKGDVDPEIDKVLVSRIISDINYSLVDVLFETDETGKPCFKDDLDLIDQLIFFIKNGLKKG